MHDPISDFIIRIKNAQARQKTSVRIPMSKVKEAIATVLVEAGYITSVKKIDEKPFPVLELGLKYTDGKPSITSMQRVSKLGGRVYRGIEQFPRPLSGHGLVIVSTPKGIMSGAKAQKNSVGGEIIATVW